MKIATITGHRPNKLNGYSEEAADKLVRFAKMVLLFYKPNLILTGMALGWDTAIALACVDLKIPFIACVPFMGQDRLWPMKSRILYSQTLEKAEEVVVVSSGEYTPEKMQIRNEYMVDRCLMKRDKEDTSMMIALWDGSSGGTSNCIQYAKLKGLSGVNVWNSWKVFEV